jgi:protein gp37
LPLTNLALGVSCEDQERADERIPELLATPAAMRWVSIEPMLSAVDLKLPHRDEDGQCSRCGEEWPDEHLTLEPHVCPPGFGPTLDWVVLGGESGPGARPMHPDWVRGVRDQCQAAGVPFFFKQWGEWRQSDRTDEFRSSSLLDVGRYIWRDGFTAGWTGPFNGRRLDDGDATLMVRVGKKVAGRLLDGRTWDELPEFLGGTK